MAKYSQLELAVQAYKTGKNITAFLRDLTDSDFNSAEIIEIAYDLQAGSFIEYTENYRERVQKYSKECADIVSQYLNENDTLLDIGTGEITTLSLLVNELIASPSDIYAFDISLSRLIKGIDFAKREMGHCYDRLNVFVADIAKIPRPDKSINITVSSHALEPNGSILEALLTELYRVTQDYIILFEPCYELNSEEGRRRMDDLGYIKGLDDTIELLGGTIIDKTEIKNIANPLNPTYCFVVQPPRAEEPISHTSNSNTFSVPGSNYPIQKQENFLISNNLGLCFPIISGIPILREDTMILATALAK